MVVQEVGIVEQGLGMVEHFQQPMEQGVGIVERDFGSMEQDVGDVVQHSGSVEQEVGIEEFETVEVQNAQIVAVLEGGAQVGAVEQRVKLAHNVVECAAGEQDQVVVEAVVPG